jgi:methionyl-tRNA formyltransferase
MKILFIGTVLFSKNILDEIIRSKNEVVGVVGKKKSGFNSDYYDIVKYSKLKKIDSVYTNNINSSKTIKWIKRKRPDIIFCIGWSQLLKKQILKLPHKGVIGYHPSDLPKNRGRHPIIWSLVLGLHKIGSCFFYMNQKADAGRIISKKILKIKKKLDSNSVYKKLIIIGVIQIKEILLKLKNNKLKPLHQKNYHSNSWRKRTEIDGKIDWRMSANNINNLVKALTKPYPGAYFLLNKKKIIVWKSKVISLKTKNIEPGKIIKSSKDIIIKCGDDALKLASFQPKMNFKNIKYL